MQPPYAPSTTRNAPCLSIHIKGKSTSTESASSTECALARSGEQVALVSEGSECRQQHYGQAEHNNPVSVEVSQEEPTTDRSHWSIGLNSTTMIEADSEEIASILGPSVEALLADEH